MGRGPRRSGRGSCLRPWSSRSRRPEAYREEGAIEARGRRRYSIPLRGAQAVLGARTLVMGILNVTPDSFSDGGRFASADAAIAHGLALFEAGADWVDVGGESTRPGASSVPAEEEIRRVVPVVEGLRRRGAGPLSIDTFKAEAARAALEAGADIVNDVSGFGYDPAMARLVAERGCPAVVMHLRGDFGAMHRSPAYADVMGEILAELGERIAHAERAGVDRRLLLVDPGLGFSKDAGHSYEALRRLDEMAALDRPVLVGPSRKRFVGQPLDLPVDRRLMGTAAAVASAVLLGAHVVRVHDVAEMVAVVRVADGVRGDCEPVRAA